jgi:hypothetical protein
MKTIKTRKPLVLAGGLAGTCLMATLAFGNPSLLPNHPGYPMGETKSPVTGQSLANDPGQPNWTGRSALEAAAKWENADLHLGVPFILRDLREGTAQKVEEIKRKAREEK